MPIYEYICDCGYETTEIQTIGSDAPLCPKCGGVMRKKFSPPAILKMKTDGGHLIRSKGYKDGYKEEYLKSTNREAWRGTITESQA